MGYGRRRNVITYVLMCHCLPTALFHIFSVQDIKIDVGINIFPIARQESGVCMDRLAKMNTGHFGCFCGIYTLFELDIFC